MTLFGILCENFFGIERSLDVRRPRRMNRGAGQQIFSKEEQGPYAARQVSDTVSSESSLNMFSMKMP